MALWAGNRAQAKVWPEQTPLYWWCPEGGSWTSSLYNRGNKKEDDVTNTCRDVRAEGFVSASATQTTLLPESHLENYHTQVHAVPASEQGAGNLGYSLMEIQVVTFLSQGSSA